MESAIVPGWAATAVVVWIVLLLVCLALLRAAKRGDAAVEAAAAELDRPATARPPAAPAAPSSAELERLARDLREELAVDQVMIVTRDERSADRAVAVAAAGIGSDVRGTSFGPRQSVAAAVALSGHAVIAPGHGPLDRSKPGPGDAAAVALGLAGAVAIARLAPGERVTADDLERLRSVVRALELAGADGGVATRAADRRFRRLGRRRSTVG